MDKTNVVSNFQIVSKTKHKDKKNTNMKTTLVALLVAFFYQGQNY